LTIATEEGTTVSRHVSWDEDDDWPVKPANNSLETEGVVDTADADPSQPEINVKDKKDADKAARLMNELILTLTETVDRNRLYREENKALQEQKLGLKKEIRQAEEELETLERIKEIEANDIAIQRDKLAEEYILLAKGKKEVQQLFDVYERKQKRFKKRLAGLKMIGDDGGIARTGATIGVLPSSKHPKDEADDGKRKCSCTITSKSDDGREDKEHKLDSHCAQLASVGSQQVGIRGVHCTTAGARTGIKVERNWHAWGANLLAFLQLLVTIYCIVSNEGVIRA